MYRKMCLHVCNSVLNKGERKAEVLNPCRVLYPPIVPILVIYIAEYCV